MRLLEKGKQELNRQIEERKQKSTRTDDPFENTQTRQKEDNINRFQTDALLDIKKSQQEFVDKNIPPEVMDLINIYSKELSKQSGHEIKKEFSFLYPSFKIKHEHEWSSEPRDLSDNEKEKIGKQWKNKRSKEKPRECSIYYKYQQENKNVALGLTITNNQTIAIWIDSKQIGKSWKTNDSSDQIKFATELVKILSRELYSQIRFSSSNTGHGYSGSDDYEGGDASFGPGQ